GRDADGARAVGRAACKTRERGSQDGHPLRSLPLDRWCDRPVCWEINPLCVPGPAVMSRSMDVENQPDLRLIDGDEPDRGAPDEAPEVPGEAAPPPSG